MEKDPIKNLKVFTEVMGINSHDIHDFIISSQKEIADEYIRIRKRTLEDTGTAGDQGEENWASIFVSPIYGEEL